MHYHELEKTTAAKLREMAQEYEDIVGAAGMNKEQLVDLLADKLGIEKPHKVVVGIDKVKIKAEIRELKKLRDKAIEGKDRMEFKKVRRMLHHQRHKLHKAIKVK
ncbi:MAG: hypothetical protein KAY24_08370 [Candidatus Eisenbacteria sp.]|nr:hypothetical protein [Candidatus Eisenbacteria bacterium]